MLTFSLYVAVFLGCLHATFGRLWVGIVLTIVPLLGDCIVRRTHKTAADIVRGMLLFQTVMLWMILPWANFDLNSFYSSNARHPHVFSDVRNIGKSSLDALRSFEASSTLTVPMKSNSSKIYSKFNNQRHSLEMQRELLRNMFGDLSESTHPDLVYRSPDEVRQKHSSIFAELPQDSFLNSLKNPCWYHEVDRPRWREFYDRKLESTLLLSSDKINQKNLVLSCLPYAYILGMPKCGTSDLFERLNRHPDVVMPFRKEVASLTNSLPLLLIDIYRFDGLQEGNSALRIFSLSTF